MLFEENSKVENEVLEAFPISRARGEAILSAGNAFRLTPVVFVPFFRPEGTSDKYDPLSVQLQLWCSLSNKS